MGIKNYSFTSKFVSFILFLVCRILTGARPKYLSVLSSKQTYIYYANHSSHLDGIIIWSCLLPKERKQIYFVAAADYWKKSFIRRYISSSVFNTVLVNRQQNPKADCNNIKSSHQALDSMTLMCKILDDGKSLIIFPEGTRGDGQDIHEFKSGIWHLSRKYPDISLVPVYLDNLHRVLPKGTFLAVPMICKAVIGKPISAAMVSETKQEFLLRIKQSLEETRNETI